MRRVYRDAESLLNRNGISILRTERVGEHPMLRVARDGVEVLIPFSTSPRSDSVSNARMLSQMARRVLKAKGVVFT